MLCNSVDAVPTEATWNQRELADGLACVAAAVAYAVGAVLQSVAARRGQVSLRGLATIIRQGPYLAGWPSTSSGGCLLCTPSTTYRCSRSTQRSLAVSPSLSCLRGSSLIHRCDDTTVWRSWQCRREQSSANCCGVRRRPSVQSWCDDHTNRRPRPSWPGSGSQRSS